MGFLGYVECDNCNHYTTFNNPDDIKIWYHPDDSRPLAQVKCSRCSNIVEARIDFDHMKNFRMRGCSIMDLNDLHSENPLTEQEIDSWIKSDRIEAEISDNGLT